MPTGTEWSSIFDLSSNKLRPEGWTSSDAAGLPIVPSIVRYDELKRGKIVHAVSGNIPAHPPCLRVSGHSLRQPQDRFESPPDGRAVSTSQG